MAEYLLKMTVGLDGVPQVTGGLQQIDAAADRMGTRTQTATGRMASGMGDIETAAGRMAGGMDAATGRMAGSLGVLHTSMMGLAAGFSLGAVISQLHSAGMAIERLNNSFEAATGSVAGGAASMSFVRAEAQRLGLDLLSTADSYMKLAAAARGTALEGNKTQQVFSAVAGASRALGLSAEQADGALLAISQMMSKGSVSAEELRGQLGERLPGAFQIAARAMGVSTAELGKMLEAGSVISDEFLPKFAAELQKTFPPGEKAMSGMTAETMRLKTAWFDLKTTVMENGGDSMFTGAIRGMKAMTEEATNFANAIGKNGGISKFMAALSPSGAFATAWGSGALKDSKKPEPMSELSAAMISTDMDQIGPTGGASYLLGSSNNIFTPPVNIPEPDKDVLKAYEKELKKNQTEANKAAVEYNKFVTAYNRMVDTISEGNPELTKENRELQKLANNYETLNIDFPTHTQELNILYEAHKKQIVALQDEKKATREVSIEFQALQNTWDNQQPEHNAAGQFSETNAELIALMKTLSNTESFYQYNDDLRKLNSLMSEAPDKAEDIINAIKRLKNAFSESSGLDALLQQNLSIENSLVGKIDDPQSQFEMFKKEIDRKYDYERDQQLKALDLAGAYADKRAAIEKNLTLLKQKYDKDTSDNAAAAFRNQLSAASDYTAMAGQAFSMLAGTQDESSREGFEAAQKYNMGAAAMNTASAVMAQLTIPGPKGWIAAGLAAAAGLIQLDTISNTTYGGGGSVTAPGAFDLSGGGGSGVGSSIGSRLTSYTDNQSEDSLQRLADASDNASRAIGKVTKGFDAIAALFTEGGFASLAAGASPNAQSALTSSQGISFTKWIGGAVNQIGQAIKAFQANNPTSAAALFDPISVYITRSIFGGGWNTTAAGMSLGIQGGSATASDYITRHKDGGWFGSDSTKTTLTNNPEWTAIINDMLTGVISSINRAAITMGTSANIAGVNMPATKISTAGRTQEEIAADMQAWLEKVGAEMALTVEGLKDYAFAGENAYLALMRLNDALVSTNDVFELIGANLVDSNLAGADFAYRLQDMFGGAEAFAESFDTYFTTMFTEAEQKAMRAAQAQRQVNDAFAALEIAAPTTKAEFVAIVNSYIAQGEAGAAMLASLINIAPTFGLIADAAEELAKAQRDLDQSTQSRLLSLTGNGGAADLYSMQISQAQELADAVEKGLDTTRLVAVQGLELAFKGLENSVAVQKAALQTTYDVELKRAQSRVESLTNTVSKLKSVSDALKNAVDAINPPSRAEAQAVIAAALVAVQSGKTPQLDTLNKALSVLQAPTEQLFATRLDWERDQKLTAISIAALDKAVGGQLTTAERALKSAERQITVIQTGFENQSALLDDQLSAAQNQLSALLNINQSIQTIPDAINTLAQAMRAVTVAQGLPSFGTGSGYIPYDMTANIHQSEMIIDSASASVLRKYGIQINGTADNREIVSELRQLRTEIRAANTSLAKNTGETNRTLKRWEGGGMPPARSVA